MLIEINQINLFHLHEIEFNDSLTFCHTDWVQWKLQPWSNVSGISTLETVRTAGSMLRISLSTAVSQSRETRWRHQMEAFSVLLALCAGNAPVTGEFPSKRPLTQSFIVFFDLHLNERLSKQSWCWWFETPSTVPIMTSLQRDEKRGFGDLRTIYHFYIRTQFNGPNRKVIIQCNTV